MQLYSGTRHGVLLSAPNSGVVGTAGLSFGLAFAGVELCRIAGWFLAFSV